MSTPLGEKTLATKRPVPLDHLATHPDTGYERLEGGQGHRATHHCRPRQQNVWSSSGAPMPCSLTISPAPTMVSPRGDSVDDHFRVTLFIVESSGKLD